MRGRLLGRTPRVLATVIVASTMATTLAACDSILSARHWFPVDMPSVASAPVVGAACPARRVGEGSVDAQGRVLRCGRVGARTVWRAAPARPPAKPLVLVYGDSIAWESTSEFRAALPATFDAVQRVYGGTAPCDWIAMVARDVRAYRPAVVVASFLGNNATPCTRQGRPAGSPPLTGDALATAYHDWLTTIARTAIAGGAVVVLNSEPPDVRDGDVAADRDRVARATWRAAWELAAQGHPVIATDVGGLLADPSAPPGTRRGVMQLRCLPGERAVCVRGLVTVRSPDGVHLCPVRPSTSATTPCSVRSPGAERFAAGLAEAVTSAHAGSAGRSVVHPPSAPDGS